MTITWEGDNAYAYCKDLKRMGIIFVFLCMLSAVNIYLMLVFNTYVLDYV
jgi:hypothetical protein